MTSREALWAIQLGRAAEASMEADHEQEAFHYHSTTETCLALALSKAHVEVKKTIELLAVRQAEIELAAMRLKGKEAA